MSARVAASTRVSPLSLLAERAFVYAWLSGAANSTIRWLDMLALGVYVFDRTGSPFQVALVTILRMLPLALFGAFSGVLAERFDRKAILLTSHAVIFSMCVSLGLLAGSGLLEIWHLWVSAFLTGSFWVVDFSARRTMLAEAAGHGRVGTAMSLESVTNNGTRMLGPTLGGLLVESLGIEGAFWLSATLYVVSAMCILALPRFSRIDSGESGGMLRRIADGVRHLRSDRTVVGVLAVTLVFNLWAFPCVSMVPVIGKEALGLSAFPVGLLMSAEGAGAFVGGLLLAGFAPMAWFRRLYVMGVVLYLGMALGFSQAPAASIAATCLMLAGLGGAAFAAMQSTLVLMNSPPEVRGRMMGLLSVCIGSGPIGFLHVGLMANHFGAPAAVALLTLEGLLALFVVWRIWPELLHPQRLTALETPALRRS